MRKDIDRELEELRKFKESSGWSDYKIAKSVDVHPQSIRNWLKGRNRPSDLARKVIKAFLASTNRAE
jgi:DNA-binding XRE family transcriptional regulator